MMSFYLLFSSLKKDLHRDSHFFFLVAVLGDEALGEGY